MAKLQDELTADLSRGMLDDVSAVRYPSNAAASIVNGRVEPDGTCRRRPGSRRKHDTALAEGTGYGAIAFQTAAGTAQLLAFVDDRAFLSEDEGETWDDVTPETVPATSDLTEGYYSFATMRVGATIYLFAANGATEIWRWDGTSFDALPNAPANVKYLAVFNSRLYAAGHSGVIVQASKIADPETWSSPDGLLIQVMTHDGDDITGLYQIGPHLLVFDRNSTSYVDGFGQATLVVAVGAVGLSRSVGCIAFRSIVGVGENTVCWLSERGVEYYSAGAGIQLLTRGVQKFFQTIDRLQIRENPGVPTAAYDDIRQEYHLALSTNGVQNNRTLIVNLLQRGRSHLAALSIDESQAADTDDEILFTTDDPDGYLSTGVGGVGLRADAEGYMTLAEEDEGHLPTAEDENGYLTTAITDATAATLFVAPSASTSSAVHSLGYDGFVRIHEGDRDDLLEDESGGIDVEMTIVSRPFLMKRPRHRKKVRIVHVATINDESATVTVAVLADGSLVSERQLTIPSTTRNQPKRKRALVKAVGDAPQVELRTTDDVRVALLGLSAEIMREAA